MLLPRTYLCPLLYVPREAIFSPLPGPASVILNCIKSCFFLREGNHGLFLLSHDFAVAPSRGGIEFPGHCGLRLPEIPSVGPYKEPEIHLGRYDESPLLQSG